MTTVSDFSQYVDLRLDDRDAALIYADALAWLTDQLPDWTPREGNIEVMLLQAMGYEVAEIIYAINRVPNAVVEIILKMYGLERDAGLQPTVTVEFTMADDTGHTIPAGTALVLDLGTFYQPVIFTTDVDLVIAPASTTGTVTATGDRYTSEANGTAIGTELTLYGTLIFADSAITTTEVAGGVEAETSDGYLIRGVQRLQRLSETYILPQSFLAGALEISYVKRATVLNNYDPANDLDDNGPVGVDGGHVTVVVYGAGNAVSGPQKTELLEMFEAGAAANLSIHIADPTMNTQDVEVAIKALSTFDPAVVYASVITALENYLSAQTWGWGTTLRRFDLVGMLDAVEGVDYVETMTEPATDIALDGVAPLLEFGTLTVTVT